MKFFLSFFIFILFFFPGEVLSQQNPRYQLNIWTGGSVDFKVLTMDQYENGGLIYDTWTRLRISYTDTNSGQQTNAWKLGFRMEKINFNSDYSGDFSNSNLSLQVANYVDSLAWGTSVSIDETRIKLTDSWTDLVTGADEGEYWIDITYRVDSALINSPPGYYNNLLFFDIARTGESYDY